MRMCLFFSILSLPSAFSLSPRRLATLGGAYAFALAISASRVTARRHFPSDVIVGSTFGYLIGRYVVHHHAAKDEPSAFSIAPFMQAPTRTYGMHVEFTPSGANLSKVAAFIGRLRTTGESREKSLVQ